MGCQGRIRAAPATRAAPESLRGDEAGCTLPVHQEDRVHDARLDEPHQVLGRIVCRHPGWVGPAAQFAVAKQCETAVRRPGTLDVLVLTAQGTVVADPALDLDAPRQRAVALLALNGEAELHPRSGGPFLDPQATVVPVGQEPAANGGILHGLQVQVDLETAAVVGVGHVALAAPVGHPSTEEVHAQQAVLRQRIGVVRATELPQERVRRSGQYLLEDLGSVATHRLDHDVVALHGQRHVRARKSVSKSHCGLTFVGIVIDIDLKILYHKFIKKKEVELYSTLFLAEEGRFELPLQVSPY